VALYLSSSQKQSVSAAGAASWLLRYISSLSKNQIAQIISQAFNLKEDFVNSVVLYAKEQHVHF
jgi:hypothetical protein